MENKTLVPITETAEPERDTARFVALFLLGVVMFTPLLIRVFDAPGSSVFGIPVLFVYLFASWSLLIALAAWLSAKIANGGGPVAPPPDPPADGGD